MKERVQPIAKAGKKPNATFKNTKFVNTSSGPSRPAEEADGGKREVVRSNLSAFLDSA